jgi:hypothetical protein
MNRTTAVPAPAPRAIPIPRAHSHVALGRRRRVLTRVIESDRSHVLAAFRTLANGVDAHTAAARTNAFYRATGLAWARCLG